MLDNSAVDQFPLVSVIIPCFNSVDFIFEAVSSVLSQTHQNFEILIVDDGSTDGTRHLLQKQFQSEQKIEIVEHETNIGAGGARNTGISLAKGKYLAFLDADDVWHPTKLERQVDFMDKESCAISHTSYVLVDEQRCHIISTNHCIKDLGLIDYMKTTGIGMSTAMINRELIGSLEFSSARTRQDTMFWLELLSRGYVSKAISEVLVDYRIRKGQLSANKLKMATRTLIVFWGIKKVRWYLRLFLYLHYVRSAFAKRRNN